jgi:hypothetical protein
LIKTVRIGLIVGVLLVVLAIILVPRLANTQSYSDASKSEVSETAPKVTSEQYLTFGEPAFSYSSKSCNYSDARLDFQVYVRNDSLAVIEAGDIHVDFKDPFGDVIGTINLDLTKTLKPGKQIIIGTDDDECFNISRYDNLYELLSYEKSKLKVDIVVSRISLSSGEIVTFEDSSVD